MSDITNELTIPVNENDHIQGRPAFFINSGRYDGSWKYEPFAGYLPGLR